MEENKKMKVWEVRPIHEAGDMIERGLPDSRGCIVTRDELKKNSRITMCTSSSIFIR